MTASIYDEAYALPQTVEQPAKRETSEASNASIYDEAYAPSNIKLDASLYSASLANPDEEAKKRSQAKALDVPIGALPSDPDAEIFRKDAKAQIGDSKGLSTWLENEDNAKISKDDFESLSGIEKTLRGIGEANKLISDSVINAGKTALKGSASAFRGIASGLPEAAASTYGLTRMASDTLIRPFTSYLPESMDFGKSISDYSEGAASRFRGTADKVAGLDGTEGWLGKNIHGGLRSVGQMAPGVIGSIITKNPSLMVAYGGGTQTGTSYTEAKKEGSSTLKASGYALTQGGLEAVFEMVPAFKLIESLKVGDSLLKTIWTQLATEVPAEQFTTLTQNFNTWAVLNKGKSFGEYLSEIPEAAASTFVATIVGTGTQTSIMHTAANLSGHFADDQAEYQKAQKNVDTFTNLIKTIEASKTKSRSPEAFTDFIKQVSGDSVYIDGRTLYQTLIENEITPEKLAEIAPETAKQMQEAIGLGADVTIPMSEFVGGLSDIAEAVLPDMRPSQDLPSLNQAKSALTSNKTEFNNTAEKLLQQKQVDDTFQKSSDAVNETLLTSLTQASPFRDDVNKASLIPMTAFYSTLAKDLNITPEEAYKEFPVSFSNKAGGVDVLTQQNDSKRFQTSSFVPLSDLIQDGGATQTKDLTLSKEGVVQDKSEQDSINADFSRLTDLSAGDYYKELKDTKITIQKEVNGKMETKLVSAHKAMLLVNQRVEKFKMLKECL